MNACPVCGAAMTPFLGPLELPVFCNVLWPTHEAARAAARAQLQLALCERCGMISNVLFEEALVRYKAGYENALHFSRVFREFAERLARRLVADHDIRGKQVVEIGCGDGHFLALLCAAGGNRGLGYDPSRPAHSETTANGGSYRIVPELYRAGGGREPAALVCMRQVLEHVGAPRGFIGEVRSAAEDGSILYVEVPDAEHMLREHAIWDLIYEHCSYFSAGTLSALLEAAGYAVLVAEPDFGGQYLRVDARAGGAGPPVNNERAVAALAELARRFDLARSLELERWNSKLGELLEAGRRVVLWGAGSKGVSFASSLDAGSRIHAAVDVNPRKHGQYLPLTAVPVVAPEALREQPPDDVIVLNPNYEGEIASALAAIGLEPRLWVA